MLRHAVGFWTPSETILFGVVQLFVANTPCPFARILTLPIVRDRINEVY